VALGTYGPWSVHYSVAQSKGPAHEVTIGVMHPLDVFKGFMICFECRTSSPVDTAGGAVEMPQLPDTLSLWMSILLPGAL
jgi:hypothetical protein